MTEVDPHGLRLAAPGTAAPVVPFTFEGRELLGVAGEPIAAALHAQGVRVLGRSAKYRRPRGLHCMADACPSCAMRVNGLPGVTTCVTPLRAGDVVDRQTGTPNADRDLLAGLDRVSSLAPVGFQYRRFRRSPRLFRHWERMLARLAGVGTIPDPAAARAIAERATWTSGATDVAVIGAGAAGVAAALAAAGAGARVTLIERREQLDPERAALLRAAAAHSLIDVRAGATAIGWYAEGVLGIVAAGGVHELRPDAVVLATGAHERPLAFAENDRPGVLLAGGAERLVTAHALRPGRRAVVVSTEDRGHAVAQTLAAAGVEVAAIADARPAPPRTGDLTVLARTTVVAALGGPTIRGARLDGPAGPRELECDTIVVANGRRPARELLLQRAATGGLTLGVPAAVTRAGADPSRPVVDGWWLAGAVAGAQTTAAAVDAGAAAGRAAAERCG